MRAPIPAIAVLAGSILGAAEIKTIADLEGNHARYRAVIGRLSQREFDKMASEVLGPAEITLGVVSAYGSPRERVVAGTGVRGDHCGYDSWRALLEYNNLGAARCPEVQEALKVGSSIIVRRVDRDCRREISLLMGKVNPLKLVVGGSKVEILFLSFSHPMGEGNEHRIRVNVYVRTKGAVSLELAKATTAQILAMTRVTNLGVMARSDIWFIISDCAFPAVFPFEDQPKVPSKEQYSRTKYATCGVFDGGPMRCFESASQP